MADMNVAIRKRQQIAQANRVMFLWVASASAIVGIAAVASITLFNKLNFNQTIIDKQAETLATLQANNKAVSKLMDNARVLDTNKLLLDRRQDKDNDKALQVILDALPSSPNRAALGASLQEVLLKLDGVTIDSLSVDDVAEASSATPGVSESVPIDFSFTATSSEINKLFELLSRLERSIRPIKVLSLDIEVGEKQVALTVKAESYYQPEVSIDLGKKVLTPGDKSSTKTTGKAAQ